MRRRQPRGRSSTDGGAAARRGLAAGRRRVARLSRARARRRPTTRSRPTSAICASSWPGSRRDLGHAPCLADLARLDARRFRAFMASRRRAGFASRSLARTMSALRAFFRWLEAQEIAHNRGVLQVALPKVPHGIPKPLTVEKAAAVVDGGSGGRARLGGGPRHGRAAAALRLRPAHLRGARAARARTRPLAGRESCASSARAARSGWCRCCPSPRPPSPATCALCPYPLEPGRPAVPRRQGRPR